MKRTAIIYPRTVGGYKTVVGVYEPQECMKEETKEYYEILHKQIQQINKTDYLYMVGDMNARLGNQPVGNVIGINGKHISQYLTDLAIYNGLQITNIHFKHRNIHKCTWNAEGNKFVIVLYLLAAMS
jgi:hypothetical protein